jgi:outer membrane protein assembly factor BamB
MPSPSRQARRAEARRNQTRRPVRTRQRREPPTWLKDPRTMRWLAAGGALVVVAVVLAIVLGGSSSSTSHPPLTGSGYPNVDTSNTRAVSGPIDEASLAQLAQAWTLPLGARSQYGSYSSTPILSGGIVYSQDLASNVQAIDAKTGSVIWTKSFESPDQGPNGLVVQGGRIFGATATAAFALDQKTGDLLWSVTLVRNAHEGIDMQPGYHDGIVYISTVPGNNNKFYGGGAVGILWALEAGTGRRLWHFDTAPANLWSSANTNVNSGGGVWYAPAFDEHGSIYIGTGNPAPFPGTAQFPWGSSRPGPDLYTDSIVKLDASTGRLEWYYQLTPHDLYDRDLQDPPILTHIGGREVVIAAGKAGFVIALDAATGRLLWKRSVGIHSANDNDGLYAMRGEYSKLHLNQTIYPGLLGGVIAPMATNGSSVFVPVVNHPVSFSSQTEPQEAGPSGGELVALDLASGAVRWDQKLPSSLFGAVTIVNNVVFATDFEGKLMAFNAASGKPVWEKQLPAGTNTGVSVEGDTLIAPAGIAIAEGQRPALVAYRLGG